MTDFLARRERLRNRIQRTTSQAMLVTDVANVRYLTGFTGEDSYLLVSLGGDLLLSDARFEQQIAEECPGLAARIRHTQEKLIAVTCQELQQRQVEALTFEGDSLSVNSLGRLREALPQVTFCAGEGLVESLRMLKDEHEVQAIRRAVAVAERVFSCIRAQLTSQQSEREIANEIERLTRSLGGSGCSFPPIVAVGPRAALPHARPGKSRIGDSPFVLLDWGAQVDGYCSDLTRVLLTSKIPPKFTEVYETVRAAQAAALAALKPGVLVSEIERLAREVFDQADMGPRFNHGLGHGIGLQVHEAPRLGKTYDRPLEAGMVVTVEPGAYFPGWGGVRIEDDVLITPQGCEILSSLPRSMDENCVSLLA